MKKDGGPAFPRTPANVEWSDGSRNFFEDQDGMTLRDYFAGQALAGYMADANVSDHNRAALVKSCYELADAMLAERDKE